VFIPSAIQNPNNAFKYTNFQIQKNFEMAILAKNKIK
jgi:hypothetical protein